MSDLLSRDAHPRRANRRLTARRACHLVVRYQRDGAWHPATAMDVSPNGGRLRLGEDLPNGSTVLLQLEGVVPDGREAPRAQVTAFVIWSRLEGLSYQVGLQFNEVPALFDDILRTV
jgi:hypothetical protein